MTKKHPMRVYLIKDRRTGLFLGPKDYRGGYRLTEYGPALRCYQTSGTANQSLSAINNSINDRVLSILELKKVRTPSPWMMEEYDAIKDLDLYVAPFDLVECKE